MINERNNVIDLGQARLIRALLAVLNSGFPDGLDLKRYTTTAPREAASVNTRLREIWAEHMPNEELAVIPAPDTLILLGELNRVIKFSFQMQHWSHNDELDAIDRRLIELFQQC